MNFTAASARILTQLAALSSDPLMLKLARGGLAALLIKVGAAGLSFLMFLALARAMSQADFGRFGLAFSLATLLAVAGSFGMRMMVLRFASIYDEDRDEPHLRGVVRVGYIAVILGCGGLGLSIAALSAGWLGFEAQGHLVAAGAFTVVLGIAEYQAHVLRALGGMTLALAPRDIVWRIGVIAVAALVSFDIMPRLDATTGIWIVTAILFCSVLGQSLLHPATRPTSLFCRPASLKFREWMRNAAWLWGSSVLQVAMPNLTIVLVGALLSAERTGGFFAAWRVAMLLSLFHLAAAMVAAPLISRYFHRNDFGSIQRTAALISTAALAPCMLVFLVFVIAGDRVLALFNPAYAEMADILIILSGGYLIHVLFGPTAEFAEMSGHQDIYFRALAVTTSAALIVLYPMTYFFDEVGAAAIFLASMVLWNLYIYIWVFRRYGIHLSFALALLHGLLEREQSD